MTTPFKIHFEWKNLPEELSSKIISQLKKKSEQLCDVKADNSLISSFCLSKELANDFSGNYSEGSYPKFQFTQSFLDVPKADSEFSLFEVDKSQVNNFSNCTSSTFLSTQHADDAFQKMVENNPFVSNVENVSIICGTTAASNALFGDIYKRFLRARPKQNSQIMLMFSASPSKNYDSLLNTMKSLIAGCIETPDLSGFLSAYVTEKWNNSLNDSNDEKEIHIGFVVLACQWVRNSLTRGKMKALSSASKSLKVEITAHDWKDDDLDTAVDYLSDFCSTITRYKIEAGYLLHPAFTSEWLGSAPLERKLPPPKDISVLKPPPPPPPSVPSMTQKTVQVAPIVRQVSNSEFFTIDKDESTGKIETIQLISRKEQRSSENFVVPLLPVIRSICCLSHREQDVEIDTLFSNLERMRSCLRDSEHVGDEQKHEDPRVEKILEMIQGIGYALPEKKLKLELEGLQNIIKIVEDEFQNRISHGKDSADEFMTVISKFGENKLRNHPAIGIEYMSLQELYKIGTIVTCTDVGVLGGVEAAFRVVDCHFEPIRSLFGGKRFSFRLHLETIVALGEGEFIQVRWQEIIEHWPGRRDIRGFRFSPRPSNRSLLDSFKSNKSVLNSSLFERGLSLSKTFGTKGASHFSYESGSFFPHSTISSRMKGLGSATAEHSRASSGTAIVDIRRGLQLGHSPASTADEAGMAIAESLRLWRSVEKSITKRESFSARMERFRNAGLKTLEAIPSDSIPLCWPTVTCFSLNAKVWGHVLVDGLKPVHPDKTAWEGLVLPPETKEVLIATVGSAVRGRALEDSSQETKIAKRYRYRDVISGKGTGMLFLLSGPPGTGKTLTVQALAEYFGIPLYGLSFAELGTNISELEERLTDVLALSSHWGSLVLLDEGDALIEKRRSGEVQLNSMTGVLLRLLESFDGALFITTNRIKNIDSAALSRVTLSIRFSELNEAGIKQVWRASLIRIISDENLNENCSDPKARAEKKVDEEFSLEKLSKFGGSGRSVGAVLRIAIALAEHRECELTQVILEDAIGVWSAEHHNSSSCTIL